MTERSDIHKSSILMVSQKVPKSVMPVPDQVRDDGSGIQNVVKLLDSGYRIESGTGPAGMTPLRNLNFLLHRQISFFDRSGRSRPEAPLV
jgi:hypothetical protein